MGVEATAYLMRPWIDQGWRFQFAESELNPGFHVVSARKGDRTLQAPHNREVEWAVRDLVRMLEKEVERDYYPGPRILIVGYGRHGKDEAAATLHKRGNLRYAGSMSWQALPFIARELDEPEQLCWEKRHDNRQFWYEYCNKLRAQDPLFLVRRALKVGNVVAGVRDKVELAAMKAEKTFDSILWVDRPGFPTDPTVTFSRDDATDFILNDRTLEHFRETVLSWAALKGYITH